MDIRFEEDRKKGKSPTTRLNIPTKEEVFTQKTSALFQRLRVVRMVDAKRKVLVYLTYSDRLIDGSPQNSLAAIPYGKP